MSIAHRTQVNLYKRHFGITDTAVVTLRELAPDLIQPVYRSDEDLANLIDEWAWDSNLSGKVEQIVDDGRPSWLIDLRGRRDDLFALVRTNNTPHKGFPEKTVITLLTMKMVEENRHSGRWTEHGTSPGRPMVSLKQKLADRVIEIVKESSNTPAPPVLEDIHRVTWLDDDDKRRVQEVPTRQAAIELANNLVVEDEVHPLDITIEKRVMVPTWEEVKQKVKVELE